MIRLLILIFSFTALTAVNVYAGLPINETDYEDQQLVGFFDLRDRETFVQVTNSILFEGSDISIHVQIFDVSNNCNENNFFDSYTQNDTHVYNLRDIQTNDGNPSGVVLPDGAYGIVVLTSGDPDADPQTLENEQQIIGNLRIEDDNGYEYRTNLNGVNRQEFDPFPDVYTFNYNTEGGVILSDIVGIMLADVTTVEVQAADILNIWASWDVDIFDLNEVPFSCRDVNFACVNQDSPQLESLLEQINNGDVGHLGNNSDNGSGNVASFEYGINESIPSSKGAPLLCPGNVVSEGFVQLKIINYADADSEDHAFTLFVGLNNGNGRGSIDAIWQNNCFTAENCFQQNN